MPWWKGEADARAGEATGAEFLRTKFVLFFILFSIREIIAILLFSLVKSLPNHKG
jgi:hypothetical protein